MPEIKITGRMSSDVSAGNLLWCSLPRDPVSKMLYPTQFVLIVYYFSHAHHNVNLAV